MLINIVFFTCAILGASAKYMGPLAGGVPALGYPAGISPEACPNFPICNNPALAANPQIAEAPQNQQFNAQPTINPAIFNQNAAHQIPPNQANLQSTRLNPEFNQPSQQQPAYNPQIYNPAYNQPSYQQPAYHQQGFNQLNQPQHTSYPGFNQAIPNQPNFNSPSLNQQSLNQDSFNQQPTLNSPPLNQQSLNQDSFSQQPTFGQQYFNKNVLPQSKSSPVYAEQTTINSIQEALNRGEYIGDGDYKGEGLEESGAFEVTESKPTARTVYQTTLMPTKYNQPTKQKAVHSLVPPGVDPNACPNYPYCP